MNITEPLAYLDAENRLLCAECAATERYAVFPVRPVYDPERLVVERDDESGRADTYGAHCDSCVRPLHPEASA